MYPWRIWKIRGIFSYRRRARRLNLRPPRLVLVNDLIDDLLRHAENEDPEDDEVQEECDLAKCLVVAHVTLLVHLTKGHGVAAQQVVEQLCNAPRTEDQRQRHLIEEDQATQQGKERHVLPLGVLRKKAVRLAAVDVIVLQVVHGLQAVNGTVEKQAHHRGQTDPIADLEQKLRGLLDHLGSFALL